MYRKWLEKDFLERYAAYQKGRAENPESTYFLASMRFLDEHIIPLCQAMQRLGCFGNSADECLAFATANKARLATYGPDIVQGMVDRYHGREEKKSKAELISQRVSLRN